MNSRRTVILIVALVVGAVAAFGLLSYVRNVEGSVYDNAEPAEVWVVRVDIPKGTPAEQALDQQWIYKTEIPASFRPATAVVEPSAELAGLVAVTDLAANSPLVSGNFVSPTIVNTGIIDRLDERDLVTVTFSVDQVKGAAYLVEPGDYVNVLTVSRLNDEGTAGAVGDEIEIGPLGDEPVPTDVNVYDFSARYVYQRAEVLAIDKELTPDLGDSADETAEQVARNSGLVTLAVTPEAAQMILTVGIDTIYLSLVPPSYTPEAIPPIVQSDQTLPGEDEQRLTPYGPVEPTADPE